MGIKCIFNALLNNVILPVLPIIIVLMVWSYEENKETDNGKS